jgi:hypothetical protein
MYSVILSFITTLPIVIFVVRRFSRIVFEFFLKKNIEGLYYDAEHHYLLGGPESVKMLACMILNWTHSNQEKEAGYCLCRSVLQ